MKFYSSILKFTALFTFILLISCGDTTKKDTPKTEINSETSETTAATSKQNTVYYSWVDNINIRDASNTKGKVIGTYSSKDALVFTGIKSDHKDIIVLRGIAYDENWLKVTTKDNKEGWVFGGAVKKKGQIKGNEIITNEKFNFPHFGSFDVTTWTNLGVTDSGGGDAETKTYRYQKNNQILEIEKTDVGEYGYYRTYRLMNAKSTLLNEREFSFTVDMSNEPYTMELTETVKDFSTKKQYMRKQTLGKHFMSLNAYPEMVLGVWEEKILEIEAESISK